jgi:putative salt-induced outer membrane protein YdiY
MAIHRIIPAVALSVGYGITDNTKSPAPLKKLDTLASVNLVFGF